ncbi:MAG: hypothetical protein K6E42_06565 [Synergistes sp.]|nr:hypothetical protein [Synergistes sp.]
MKYTFYDPPLKYSCFQKLNDPPETRASEEDIKKLEEESVGNYDVDLALIDYALHFGHVTVLDYYSGMIDGIGLCYPEVAFCYGGCVAVYRECIKRNISINKLFGYDNCKNKEETPIAEFYGCKTYEECVEKLKARREEILGYQRYLREHQPAR